MVEHLLCKEGVRSSSLLVSTGPLRAKLDNIHAASNMGGPRPGGDPRELDRIKIPNDILARARARQLVALGLERVGGAP